MDNELNISLLKLNSVSEALAAKPSKEKLTNLEEVLRLVPDTIIQTLHEYILFPFFISLHSEEVKKNNELHICLLDTLQNVLSRTHMEKIKTFTRLHMALVQQIYDKDSPNLVRKIDEDIKLKIMQCLETLFINATNELRFDLYSKQHGFQLAQSCQVCIQLAQNEKYRALRIKAIECLMALAYIHNDADTENTELRNKVADIFMFLLPGITIGLVDIANGDVKQGHKITALAVTVLNRIIVLLMHDVKSKEKEKVIIQYPVLVDNYDEAEVESTKLNIMDNFNKRSRDNKWYKITANKLKTALDMINLQHHNHPKVRYEMADLCENIIVNCTINMSASLNHLIEILISLSEDDDLDVSYKNKSALFKMFNKTNYNLQITAQDIVQENFYSVLSSFPRIMNETDLSKKVNTLNLIIGYLRIMDKNLESILQSSSHLKRLILSLIHVSQLERSNISLFEEHAIRDFQIVSQSSVTWKQFTYISEKELFCKFQAILRLLSESNAINIIIDQICDVFIHGENKNESIFIINELIIGKFLDTENKKRVINRIFNMYMEEDNWNLDLNVKSSENKAVPSNVSLFTVHSNIIQTCLLVEGIGNMAVALGNDFKSFLFKALYLILERAGSAQPLISASGFLTLSNISKSCGYTSVTHLIVDNTDYFSFHVTQKLKRLEQNHSVLDVLNVVMTYSTKDVLPSIMDIVNKVLLQSCDKFQENNATSFLKVFLSFMQGLIRWQNINMDPIDRHTKLLLEYKKTMDDLYNLYSCDLTDNDLEDEPITENLNEEDFRTNYVDNTEEYKKPEPPEYIKLTVNVLKRSLNFLPNKERQRKLLVLDILKFGVKIISSWEDELLPIIHLIWSPFIGRFKELSDPLIINKSFELLLVLATTSKNFIRQRTSKNIFGDICSNLKNLSKESFLKDRGSAYRYTQSYKLQMNLLKNMAQLITDLEMNIDDINIAMESSMPYLSNKQPIPLQELAIHFYKNLAYYDFDSVWLFLIEKYGSKKAREEAINQPDNSKNLEAILKILNLAKW